MPDVAADSDEGVLAAWLVEESARFDAAQTIAYVETEDELFSVEAGRPGLLLKTLVEPGTRVEPGTPIGILGEPWEQVQDLEGVLSEVAAHRAPLAAEAASPLVEEGALAPVTRPGDSKGLASPLVEQPAAGTSSPPVEEGAARPTSPLVEEGAPAPVTRPGAPRHGAPDEPERQHHYLRVRVRVDRLVTLSARLERDRPDSSVLDLVGRAIVAAHRQVPQIGVARIEEDKKASPGIPVTYPGRFGVEEAAPVVPTGQAAALAVGAVRDEPVIDAGAVVPGKVMTLTLSVRAGRIDDVQASRWLAVLVALLERPEWLID